MADTQIGQARSRGWLGYLLLYGIVGGFVCFAWLGETDVVSMEGIVADGARHMSRTGDLAVPHLYGQVYAYKPPLTYWLAAGSFELFGRETPWTLRFPIAVCGFLAGAGFFLILGRILGPRAACFCALAALTGVLVIQKVRIAEFDMPLAAGTGMAIVAACANLASRRPKTVLWMVCYVGLAFGFLAKGVPAVAFYGPGLVIAAVATRRPRALLSVGHGVGVVLFFGVVGAWVWAACHAHGVSVFEQPWTEARVRGLAWSWQSLGNTLVKPLTVAMVFLPWSALLALSLSRGWWRVLDSRRRRLAVAAGSFLLTGIAVFMVVPTDASRYCLPMCAPIGILAGLVLTTEDKSLGRWARARRFVCAGCAGVASAACFAAACGIGGGDVHTMGRLVLGALGCVAAVGLVCALRGSPLGSASLSMILTVLCIGGIQALVVQPSRAVSRSLRPVAAEFAVHVPIEATLWTAEGDSHSSLFFYLGRPVRAFSIQTGAPPVNAFVIVTSDDLARLDRRAGFAYTVLQRVRHKRDVFILARIRPPQADSAAGATE